MSAHREDWQAIVDSAEQPAAVARHLGILTASDLARGPQLLRIVRQDILGRCMFAAVSS